MNSYRKGYRGEREVAGILSAMFKRDVRRGASPYLLGIIAPDVYGLPGLHIEVKRRSRPSLPAAVPQRKSDALQGDMAIVLHRGNRHPWLLTCELADLPRTVETCNSLLKAQEREPTP
jgi:hypothetical protein